MIKKIFKKASIILAILAVSILLYLLVAFTCSRITISEEKDNNRGEVYIFILTNGVHTDIVMPVKTDIIDWSQLFPYNNSLSKNSIQNFVSIGWGDKGFYLEIPEWADLTPGIALKAAFGLSKSALHVTYYKKMTEDKDCIKIPISNNQYLRIVEFIKKTIQTDESGRPIYIDTSVQYGVNDRFYEANDRYWFFYTCNTWANHALKYSGQKAALWTITDSGIFCHYK